jgi:hypothetical protein
MGWAIAVRTDYTIDEARGVSQAVEGEQVRQSSGDCGTGVRPRLRSLHHEAAVSAKRCRLSPRSRASSPAGGRRVRDSQLDHDDLAMRQLNDPWQCDQASCAD